MSQFTRENYIHIEGFMITDLGLKGNELILYAIIYGYSQDGRSKFLGSINYIMTALNVSNRSAINISESLIKKGLIIKSKGIYKGQECNQYEVNLQGSEESSHVKKVQKGSEESSHNNNNYIYTQKEFLKRWSDARKHYLNKPTHITRLRHHQIKRLEELSKDYTPAQFDIAIKGIFENSTIAQTTLNPNHFLEEFEQYYTAGVTGEKIYQKTEKKKESTKKGMI